MTSEELKQQQADIEAAYQTRSEDDFLLFVQGLVIPSQIGPRLFYEVMAPYQAECFRDLGAVFSAVRDGRTPKPRRLWIERTKGAGKDSDLAAALMWLLAFPRRPLYLQIGAADKDQAAIVRRRMEGILYHNEWLKTRVRVSAYRAVSLPGSHVQLDILAADVAGSHGEAPDVLIVNELSHVTKWEFVENLMDNADKVGRGCIVVATNAGFRGTKAEQWRRNAEESADWKTYYWQVPAPWITKENVADARRRNPLSRFNRLWYGKWASGKGDALSEDDIDWCLSRLAGPTPEPQEGWLYVGGLDLGISHDHAGLAVLGASRPLQKIRLAWMRAWAPRDSKTGEVDLQAIEESVLKVSRHYRLEYLGYDPYEARLMGQRLRGRQVPAREFSFGQPKNLVAMASFLMQALQQRVLEAWDDEDGRLRRDLGKFNIVEKQYGYRLEATSDEFGHADVGTALAIALPRAMQMLGFGGFGADDELIGSEDGELSKDDEADLPEEFRELYEMCDRGEREADDDERTAAVLPGRGKRPRRERPPRRRDEDEDDELPLD